MEDRSVLERLATVETKMVHIEKDLQEIARGVAALTALANQGKGSLKTFLWLGGLVAGVVGLVGSAIGFNIGIGR